MYCSYELISIDTHKPTKPSKNREYERGYLGNYQR